MLHSASDDISLEYLSGNSSDGHKITKDKKFTTFAACQNIAMMSLLGIIKTKKLPHPGEATYNTINIS